MADFLRNSAQLREALQIAVEIALPPGIRDFYVSCFRQGVLRTPSPTVISHTRFILDMAFLVVQQARFKKNFESGALLAIYVLTGSLPQGGVNWQIASYDLIEHDKLVPLATRCREFISKSLSAVRPHHNGRIILPAYV